MEQARLQVEVKALEGRPVISAAGELDTWSADAFREAVQGVLREKPSCLIVDLTRVEYMDSGALQVLVGACRELGEDGKVYAIVNGIAERLIHTTGLDRMIAMHRTLDELGASGDD